MIIKSIDTVVSIANDAEELLRCAVALFKFSNQKLNPTAAKPAAPATFTVLALFLLVEFCCLHCSLRQRTKASVAALFSPSNQREL